ncbi:MAG: hypothetical protein ACRDHW_05450 [Ktedonobacteraceae bacterium]
MSIMNTSTNRGKDRTDIRHFHPDTFELVYGEYARKKTYQPTCNAYHQIYNTLCHYAPDIRAVIAAMARASAQIIVDMRTYPEERGLFTRELHFQEEFCEVVQETPTGCATRLPGDELKSLGNIPEKEGARAVQRRFSMKRERPASSEWERVKSARRKRITRWPEQES